MSDKTHKKQLDRARQKREADRLASRAKRSRVLVLVMVALLVVSLVGAAVIGLGSGDAPAVDDVAADDPVTEPPVEDVPEGPCPEPGDEVPTPTTVAYDEPPRTELEDGVTYTATIDTTCGVIEVELDAEGAPRTVENFVALAEDQYYNGVPFHRTIAGFMIQGGDPTGTGTGCVDSACETQLPGYTIDEETETPSSFEPYAGSELEAVRGATAPADAVVYPYGTVAMAKTDQPSSTGGQFFIVEEPLGAALSPEYSVLGTVTSGMEVVQDIAAGPVEGDRALRPVAIRAVTIERS